MKRYKETKTRPEIAAVAIHNSSGKKLSVTKSQSLSRFGFRFEIGGTHSARTLMLDELRQLFTYVQHSSASKADYLQAIKAENCLAKLSGQGRSITARHLLDLYALDPAVTLFRTMLFFWNRDPQGQPLLAMLCAYSRDAILRLAAPTILGLTEGSTINSGTIQQLIDDTFPDRFSKGTLGSTSRNINASWTKSGHLAGRSKKVRTKATATAGSVSYALLLGYLAGVRGESLFSTAYAKLLDCSKEKAIQLAEEASRRGWIVFKRVGNVMEVLFPTLLTAQEMEWVREQN